MFFSVGDPSGSHSERWILHVGTRKFQNDVHGEVVSTTYSYGPGSYDIWLEHWDTTGTNCWPWEASNADYDYEARLEKMLWIDNNFTAPYWYPMPLLLCHSVTPNTSPLFRGACIEDPHSKHGRLD